VLNLVAIFLWVWGADLLVSHTKVFVVRSGNLRPVQFAPTLAFWLSIRQCQLLISSGTPTALPSFIHKNTTHIQAEAVTLCPIKYMGMWRCNFTLNTEWGQRLLSRSGRFAAKKEPPLSIHWEAQWASELVSVLRKREWSFSPIWTRILNSKSYCMAVMTTTMVFLNFFFTVIPQFKVIGVYLSVH